MKKIISVVAILAMVLGIACLSGCGSSKTDSDTLVIAKGEDAETMDPDLQSTSGGIQMLSAVGEGLVRSSKDGKKVEGALAKSWNVSNDGTTYTFNLRDGLKFSDGNDVTLEDWQFTFNRAATLKDSMWNYVTEDITSVTMPEKNKLVITISKPSASFLARMAMFPAYVQEKANYDKVGDDGYAKNGAIFAGPYAIDKYKHGEYLNLKKNKYYYDADSVKTKNISFKITTDDDSKVDMLKSGEVDVAESVPASSIKDINSSDGVKEKTFNSTLTKYLILNNKDSVLSNKDVRKAISLAINKKDIVKVVLDGNGEPASSYMSKYGQSYNEDIAKQDKRDVKEAKELLKNAGYGDGFTLTVLINSGNKTEEDIVSVLQEDLKEIGITVKTDAEDPSAYQEKKMNMEHQACIATWIDDMIDPDGLNGYWWDTSVNNAYYSGFESSETSSLYQKTRTEMNADTRTSEFKQLQQLYFDNTVSVPLYYSGSFVGISDNVRGYQLTPLGAYYKIGQVVKK